MRLRLHTLILVALFAGAVVAQDPPPPAKEYNPNAWKEFTSTEGQFSVSLPGTPSPEQRPLNSTLGKLTTYAFVLQTDTAFYYVSYVPFPNLDLPLPPEELRAMLDASRDRAVASGARVIAENEVSVAGTTGRELLAQQNGAIIRTRYLFVHGKLYQLIIAVPPNVAFRNGKPSANAADRTDIFEQTSRRFFDSFKITN